MLIIYLKTKSSYKKNPHKNTDNVLTIKFYNRFIHSNFLINEAKHDKLSVNLFARRRQPMAVLRPLKLHQL